MATKKPNNYEQRAKSFDEKGDEFGYGPLSYREFGEEGDAPSAAVESGVVKDRRGSMAKGYRAKRIR